MNQFLADRIQILLKCASPKIEVIGPANAQVEVSRKGDNLQLTLDNAGTGVIEVPARGEWIVTSNGVQKVIDCSNTGVTYSVNLNE